MEHVESKPLTGRGEGLRMPPTCSVSGHPDRVELERIGSARAAERYLVERYSEDVALRLSRSAIDRHIRGQCQCSNGHGSKGHAGSVPEALARGDLEAALALAEEGSYEAGRLRAFVALEEARHPSIAARGYREQLSRLRSDHGPGFLRDFVTLRLGALDARAKSAGPEYVEELDPVAAELNNLRVSRAVFALKAQEGDEEARAMLREVKLRIREIEMDQEDAKLADDARRQREAEANRERTAQEAREALAAYRALEAEATAHRQHLSVKLLAFAEGVKHELELHRELHAGAAKLKGHGVTLQYDMITDAVQLVNAISWALFSVGGVRTAAHTPIARFVDERQRTGELSRFYEEELRKRRVREPDRDSEEPAPVPVAPKRRLSERYPWASRPVPKSGPPAGGEEPGGVEAPEPTSEPELNFTERAKAAAARRAEHTAASGEEPRSVIRNRERKRAEERERAKRERGNPEPEVSDEPEPDGDATPSAGALVEETAPVPKQEQGA
jgi:hypothetical protein